MGPPIRGLDLPGGFADSRGAIQNVECRQIGLDRDARFQGKVRGQPLILFDAAAGCHGSNLPHRPVDSRDELVHPCLVCGDPTQPLKRLKERNFIEINRDNFNQVMARMTPGLNLRVENTLEGDGSEMAVQLKFSSMKDFEPARVVEQVKPLRELMEARRKLTELKTKVDLEVNLEDRLQELLSDPDKLRRAGSRVAETASPQPTESKP